MMMAPPPTLPPHEVSGLTIMPPTNPPKLVASYPAEGQAVSPGVLVLKLTFDQRMIATGFDVAPAPGAAAPACLKTPRLLNDGKTFVLLCTVGFGGSYSLALNSQDGGGFQNEGENRAQPVTLSFTTTRNEPIRSLPEAMQVQKLGPLDGPVQEDPKRKTQE